MPPLTPTTEKTTETASLHGLRTVFNIFVVLYHTFSFITIALDHPSHVKALRSGSPTAQILSVINTLGVASVDIFFLISGFFLSSSFKSYQPLNTYHSLRYIIFRYLRLAPAYITISLTLRYLGNTRCIHLPELFFLHIIRPESLCIFPGWSTSTDFVSHILLLPFLRTPKILVSIVLLTPPLRFWKWRQRGSPFPNRPITVFDFCTDEYWFDLFSTIYGLPRGIIHSSHPDLVAYRTTWFAHHPLYFGLIYRIAPVAVGILLHSSMRHKNRVYRTVRAFPTLSLLFATAVWTFFHIVEQDVLTHHWAKVTHYSAGRILITIATSIIIVLTCTVDDQPSNNRISSFLRKLLSFRLFALLSEFSYVIYLLHTGIGFALGKVPPRVTRERVTPGWIMLMGVKWYLVTLLLGLPIWGIEWMALKGRRQLLSRTSIEERNGAGLSKKKTA